METLKIAALVQIGMFTIILFFTLLYSILILFGNRFHQRNNILTLNICITATFTCIYFIIYFILYIFDQNLLFAEHRCHFLLYAYNMSSIGIPFSFVAISVHRFFSIVYHTKRFFKTKQWIRICISSQWITELIISLPFILRKGQVGMNIRNVL
ncbi:unnamed protein product [Rotaria sp. Silwood2]|nr:unnamed protein product [Rotaria sp. Silwood2]CAF2697676.1 unnamed protein product [Rotaria sp. Silwood2]CAF3068473.1 unnamed protein product [Rotaria sp. Silwood2]